MRNGDKWTAAAAVCAALAAVLVGPGQSMAAGRDKVCGAERSDWTMRKGATAYTGPAAGRAADAFGPLRVTLRGDRAEWRETDRRAQDKGGGKAGGKGGEKGRAAGHGPFRFTIDAPQGGAQGGKGQQGGPRRAGATLTVEGDGLRLQLRDPVCEKRGGRVTSATAVLSETGGSGLLGVLQGPRTREYALTRQTSK
ncbi:hypothetical protein ACN20G_30720 (plasmid) [Streptomyces sp. BI20]|uniref:hypothetical protein n=1 Tax=Streptomyces sp. BI20 TaxID=3403460 RepID=UPI003C74098F